jgi:hypothetical protein
LSVSLAFLSHVFARNPFWAPESRGSVSVWIRFPKSAAAQETDDCSVQNGPETRIGFVAVAVVVTNPVASVVGHLSRGDDQACATPPPFTD